MPNIYHNRLQLQAFSKVWDGMWKVVDVNITYVQLSWGQHEIDQVELFMTQVLWHTRPGA